jgi:3(or 17)beta-hydroxysteroid dehydrogenase
MTGRVAGKIALVTGGASGLGRADAEVLAREGATVVVTDVAAAGEAVAAGIRAAGGMAFFLQHDVSAADDWARVVGEIRRRCGMLHVLVNNAGIVIPEDPEHCTLASFRRQSAIMTEGVFLGCQAALPLMKDAGAGSVINVCSIASHLGYPAYFAYSATKGAVRSMSKALAVHCQMKGYNVRVNTIHPGAIDTPMLDQSVELFGLKSKAELSPVGIGRPEDVANAVLFLASDESRFVNGTELLIDNALSIR